MAKINEALDMCVEIGRILSETDEYQNMKQAETNILHDQKARSLVEGLQRLQMEMQQKKLAGLPLTEEDNQKMKETETQAMENPVVKASYDAHEKFQGMMSLISVKIREGIRAKEQPEMVEDDDE